MQACYLQKADDNLPPLLRTVITPAVDETVLSAGDTLVIDLGDHYVGYFSFKLWFVDVYIDAPVRMAVRFCETARELEDDHADYRGVLCPSWLQEEIINLDFPGEHTLPRRYAARYIRIHILHTPRRLSLSRFAFEAVTSADMQQLQPADIADAELSRIDAIAVNTLKNCMQRVFEDGPKRDRRLWIGDLRLEALANHYTFGNAALVRRCLYLFAASDRNQYGIMPGFVYENPIFCSGDWYMADYSLMFICTLCDLYTHTGDTATFDDLYPIACEILDVLDATKNEQGLVTSQSGDFFIDWCDGLNRCAASQGVYLYTLDIWCAALEAMGRAEQAAPYRRRLLEGRAAAVQQLYNSERDAFLSQWDAQQHSVHAAAWMVLGGVVCGEQAQRILCAALDSPDSVKPFTPYMHHYAVEALVKCGAMARAEQYIRGIWGGMAKTGADTFFEIYAPGDPDFSPYGDRKINSMCHAWSCTPTYFIRKYGLGRA